MPHLSDSYGQLAIKKHDTYYYFMGSHNKFCKGATFLNSFTCLNSLVSMFENQTLIVFDIHSIGIHKISCSTHEVSWFTHVISCFTQLVHSCN